MIKTLGVTAISLALVAPVIAQNGDATADNRVVRSVTVEDLEAVVMSLDHIVARKDEAKSIISAQTEDGVSYAVQGTACNSDKQCQGINLTITYDRTEGITADNLNAVNIRYAAAKVWVTDDIVGVSRYLILDGGMTVENIKVNITTLLLLGEVTVKAAGQAETVSTPTPAVADLPTEALRFGTDEGDYANDGTCDDGRFHTDGPDFMYKRAHVLRDATDCRAAMQAQTVKLELDFGDDRGEYANDGTCDDVRFEGDGRSILVTDSHIMKDASDCIAAFQDGTISPIQD